MQIKHIILLINLVILGGCSLGSSKYDLVVNEKQQVEQKKLADFESKRVQKELSSWQ